jgi:hypothetical protein
MRQMRAVSQSANQDDEPYRIKSERHSLNPRAATAAASLPSCAVRPDAAFHPAATILLWLRLSATNDTILLIK